VHADSSAVKMISADIPTFARELAGLVLLISQCDCAAILDINIGGDCCIIL
jgi:hypothetical protein